MEQITGDIIYEHNRGKRKRFFSPQGKIIDTFCYEWYLKCINENQPVSGRLIKEKALEIARSMHYSGFCASNGWLQRWRLRNNVNLKLTPKAEHMDYLNIDKFNKYIENGTGNYGYDTPKSAKRELFELKPPKDSFRPVNNFDRNNHHNANYFNTVAYKYETPKSEPSAMFELKPPQNNFRPENNIDKDNDSDADYFDPLAFTEVSYGTNGNQDEDDDIIFVEENETRFKIDSYASALNAIEDLKNFAQDDDIALEYLRKIECHFQNERLN